MENQFLFDSYSFYCKCFVRIAIQIFQGCLATINDYFWHTKIYHRCFLLRLLPARLAGFYKKEYKQIKLVSLSKTRPMQIHTYIHT